MFKIIFKNDFNLIKRSFDQMKNIKTLVPGIMESAASLARDSLYKRVKDGWGVSSEKEGEIATKERLTKLSLNYKKYRRGELQFYRNKTTGNIFTTTNPKYIKKFVPGEFFKPDKSNATLTGQMLNALTSKVKGKTIVVFVSPSSRTDSKLNNKQVQEYYSKKRPFLSFTEAEVRKISNYVFTNVRNVIRNKFK